MYRVQRVGSGFTGALGVALLLISLLLVPDMATFAQGGGGGANCPFGCSTPNCYRTGKNMCNKTGDECRQKANYKLCGQCVCTPHEPDPCTCD
jgi:hypothetical protein